MSREYTSLPSPEEMQVLIREAQQMRSRLIAELVAATLRRLSRWRPKTAERRKASDAVCEAC